MAANFVPDDRNTNTLWAGVLVETLFRSGVRHAVVSPGSRSTPMAIALASHREIGTIPVLDERSAGFFALGLAKREMSPVALVCTSGTAGANYFPAVIEAHESGVPLVVLTADRPPELRASASGQTIDQQKLYGGYVEFYHELAVPEPREPLLRYLRQMVAHAVNRTQAGGGSPVHLNVPFRDPLAPLRDDGATAKAAAAIDWTRFFGHVAPPVAARVATPLPAFPATARGVIIVGPNQPTDGERFVEGVATLARRLGCPVLADGLSPVRNHAARVPHVISTYDLILRNDVIAERLRPEVVLCLGGWPISKVLRGWIEASSADIFLATARRDNRDALHGRTVQLLADPATIAAPVADTQSANEFTVAWSDQERRARAALDRRLESETGMFEPKAAWLLARHLPAGTPLVIANSMPIRDVEYVWPPGDRGVRPLCNRGANGIDGTLSTALGLAHGAARPAVLLTGDLALLHDSNGMLLRSKFRGSLTIVVINNRGGGIFEHLPVAGFNPPFEEFFATPQDIDFAEWCRAYGIEHATVRDWNHFAALVASLPAGGIRLLEIRTDRKKDAAMRKQWFAEIAAAL